MTKYQVSRAKRTTMRYENPFQEAQRLRPRSGNGEQGRGICPHCGADVALRLANREYQSDEIKYNDLVCSNHAVGGGRKGRNNYYCPGSGSFPSLSG